MVFAIVSCRILGERAIAVNGGTIITRNHPDGGLLLRIALPL
jgi:hypothetical protein